MKKLVALLLCFVMLFCVVSCNKNDDDTNDSNAVESTEKEEAATDDKEPEESSGDKQPVAKEPYSSIISRYKKLLVDKKNGKTISKPAATADEIEVALYDTVSGCKDISIMGYATKDINSDGVEELVLLDKSNKLYALFTLKNSSPKLLFNMNGWVAVITSGGTIYTTDYIEDKGNITHVKKIVDGELLGLEWGVVVEGENATYYKVENGVRSEITKEESLNLDNSLSMTQFSSSNTKKTGFRFVSAFEDKSGDGNAPIADFSSYDGVLAAYKIIVESLSEYKESKWVAGEFDSLFTISDNATYDIFHEIFCAAVGRRPTKTYFGQDYAEDGDNAYGYAKKDINGDGVEELILLDDEYEIFSIFTMKDGKAVMLCDTYGAWIDENGRIYTEKWTGGVVGRDSEHYVYEISDGKLNSIVAVGFSVNGYLQKENWYKIENGNRVDISKEEGEALYAQHDVMPGGYSPTEYTRTFSGLKFVSLFESSLASQKYINTYTNNYFVGGSALTISAVSGNSVSFTFENRYTVSEFDPDTNPEPEVIETFVTSSAVLEGDRYVFEQDGIKGYIDFNVTSAWVVVTESENENVAVRAYLFNYPEEGDHF